jgi:iron complex transport system ATP-binding protein
MRRPKEQMRLGKSTFLELIASTGRKVGLPVAVIQKDIEPGRGPLGGVYTAFKQTNCDAGLFLSCDMPLITSEYLSEIYQVFLKSRKAVFTKEQGRAGFPFIIPMEAMGLIERQMNEDDFSLQLLAKRVKAQFNTPAKSERKLMVNVNSPEDFKRAETIWKKEKDRNAARVLQIRNMNVRRGGYQLVQSLEWEIKRGEHWVILGSNGSGKTTLLSALLGYITPTSGQISVLGEEYGEGDWPELRKKIGVVSSSIRQMMPETEPAWITVASGRYAMIDYWGTPKEKDREEALKLLKQIECDYLWDREWGYLSQGERQRVLIGRSLMAQPALLILDEPCAGLDPAAREHFLQFLQRLGRKPNAPSLVLVTHHVEEIMPIFTHVLLLKNGKKLDEGRMKSVLVSEKLSDAFSSRIELRKQKSRYFLQVKSKRGIII